MNRDQIVLSHAGFARLELIAATLSDLLAKAQRAWAMARVRRELHELPDRTLDDIGLSRAQIDKLFR